MKEIVIIGAGYAGVRCAKQLETKLFDRSDVRVTLINSAPYHTVRTRLHEVAGARVSARDVCLPLEDIFSKKRVRIIIDTIVSADFNTKTLTGEDDQTYFYDFLVFATGTVPAYFGTPGAAEISYPLSTYYDAERLRGQIFQMVQEASDEPEKSVREEMLCFFVTGGGFTGVEFAGELTEWLPILCERYGVVCSEASIILVDMAPQLVPALPTDQAQKSQRQLEKMGVQVKLSTKVKGVTEHTIVLEENGVESVFPTRTVVWTAGISGVPLMEQVSTTLKMNGRLRLETDRYLRVQGAQHVYAVGDNMFWVQGERPVPQTVENAEESGEVAADNIVTELDGEGAMTPYIMVSHGTIVSIGKRFGVGRVSPYGKKGIKLPAPFAVLAKHFIHANYERSVRGGDAIPAYIRSQLVKRKNVPGA